VACPSNRKIERRRWAFQQDAGIVDEIAGGKIVGAIDDDVEVLEKFESVGR